MKIVAFTTNDNNAEEAKKYELPKYIAACKKYDLIPRSISSREMYKWNLIEPPFAAINLIQVANETHARFLRSWEISGTKVLNPILSSKIADDKMFSHLEILRLGLPAPKTIDFNAGDWNHDVLNVIEKKLNYPYILKVNNQSRGIGVCIVKDKYEAADFFDLIYSMLTRYGDYINSTGNIIAQEYMKKENGDIRAVILNGKLLGCFNRKSLTDWKGRGDPLARKSLNANYLDHTLINYTRYQLPKFVEDQCLLLCNELKLKFAGIDLFFENNTYYFGEINSQQNLRNFELLHPELDVTDMIIKSLID